MTDQFFERPILNSPYEYPNRHWELDEHGQPTQKISENRRSASFITPIPKPKKRKSAAEQQNIVFDEGQGLSTEDQQYDPNPFINDLRRQLEKWRSSSNPNDWQVTPETARLLQHWRHHKFSDIRPFFCQIEAVEVAIWLTEVAPQVGKTGKKFLEHLANANNDANPELMRLALKLATGAGKTTVMAMRVILDHDWPGNIRELENIIQRGITFATGELIQEKDLGMDQVKAEVKRPLLKPSREDGGELLLNALRENNFEINQTAAQLKMNRNTVTARFKGICFDMLVWCGMENAVKEIAEISSHQEIVAQMVNEYWKNLINTVEEFEEEAEAIKVALKRNKNVPAQHHAAIEELVRNHCAGKEKSAKS